MSILEMILKLIFLFFKNRQRLPIIDLLYLAAMCKLNLVVVGVKFWLPNCLGKVGYRVNR